MFQAYIDGMGCQLFTLAEATSSQQLNPPVKESAASTVLNA